MIHLRLTENDYRTLLWMLGYACGHSSKEFPNHSPSMELVDWIMLQGSGDNYLYWDDKETLKKKKELELKAELDSI